MQKSDSRKILIVDLDKTLCPVDTLRILRHRWLIRHPFQLRTLRKWRDVSKQNEKIQLWKHVSFGKGPIFSKSVIELISDHRNNGYEIALVSGSSQDLVEWFSSALEIRPEFIIGSDEDINLTKGNKAKFVQDFFSTFYKKYVGDSTDDYHVWKVTNSGVVVRNKGIEIKDVLKINPNIEIVNGPSRVLRLSTYFKLLLS